MFLLGRVAYSDAGVQQLACIMEVLGVPDKHIVERSSRRKLFFGKLELCVTASID